METLGGRLRELRLSKRLKQARVAELVHVNQKQISYYENDERQPSYDVLIRLASLYGVTTDYLLGYTFGMTIDVSGLTTSEVVIVSDLIGNMSEKNKRLLFYEGTI